MELSKDGLDGASLGQQTAAFKQYNEEVGKATQQHNNLNTAAVETQKQFKEAERAQKAYSEASVQAQEANIRAADAAKQAGDGAFTAARGFALLAASNEESAAEMLKAIAVAQGAFDIFKGGVDVVRGLYEANKALTAASAAATAAEAAKAGAITATGAAATAATPKLVAMNLAMGPIGIGLTAIGAAAAAGIALWRSYGDAGESELDRVRQAAERELSKQQEINDAIRIRNEEADAVLGVLDGQDKINAIRNQIGGLGSEDSAAEITSTLRALQAAIANQQKVVDSLFAEKEEAKNVTGDVGDFLRSRRRLASARDVLADLESQLPGTAARTSEQLEAEREEFKRRQQLESSLAREQVLQINRRQAEIDRQIAKSKNDPLAGLDAAFGVNGKTDLQQEREQLERDKQAVLDTLKGVFADFSSELVKIRQEQAETKRLIDSAPVQ